MIKLVMAYKDTEEQCFYTTCSGSCESLRPPGGKRRAVQSLFLF